MYTWPAPEALSFPISGLAVSEDEELVDVMTTVAAMDQPTKDALLLELQTMEKLNQLYTWPKAVEAKYVNDALTIAVGENIPDVMTNVAALTADEYATFRRELLIQELLQEVYNFANEPSGSDFGFPNSTLDIRKDENLEDVMTNVKVLDQADQEALVKDLKVQREADLYFQTGQGGIVNDWLDEREQESIEYNDPTFRPAVKDAIIKKLLTWHHQWQVPVGDSYSWDSVPITAEEREILEDFMANKVDTLTDEQKDDFLYELQSCETRENGPPVDGSYGDCPLVLASGQTCQPQCRNGLTPSGSSFCINGIYNQPTCRPDSCSARVAPANGTFGTCPTTLGSGSTCQPTCNAGFTVSGVHSCFEGVLSQAICNPNPCPAQIAVANGTFGNCPASLTSGSTCQPTCNEGYTVAGFNSCLNGVLTTATCVPNPCTRIASPANGDFGSCPTDALSSGQVCTPTCDEGFSLSGQHSCLNGVLTMASCLANACSITAPVNGFLGECNNLLESGSECQVTCSDGYQAVGKHRCVNGQVEAAVCEEAPVEEENDDVWNWWMWVIIALSILAAVLLLALLLLLLCTKYCCGPGKQKVYVYRSKSQRLKIQQKQERESQREKAQNKV
jgi:hypothetical protein